MGCSHCMVEAEPFGEHMPFEVFEQTLDYLVRMGSPMVFISGGEPSEHPELPKFLLTARERRIEVLLLSNGEFLADPELASIVLPLVYGIQVTNDPRFYPRQVVRHGNHKVIYETAIRQVAPFGLARKNNLPCNRKAPFCFNLRSLTRKTGDYRQAINYLWGMGRPCTPSVNVDGTIVAGEAPSCHPIGLVLDSNEMLTQSIKMMTCSRCGLVDNLTHEQQVAIGEARIVAP